MTVMVCWNEILSLKSQNEATLWLKDSYSSPSSHVLQLYKGEGSAIDFVIPKLLSTTKNFRDNSNKKYTVRGIKAPIKWIFSSL